VSALGALRVKVRRAVAGDYPAMLALQEANLLDNLSEQARASGFLSARFNAEQFGAMNDGCAIVVAELDGRLAGYACCCEVEFGRQFPILAAMISTFDRHTFMGTALIDTRTALYGPVCVDRELRGRGVFRQLIAGVRAELADRYDAAVAFIAKSNTHSLEAHVDGLGMNVVGDFSMNGRNFWIVAFGIPRSDLGCGIGSRALA
jgi:GNAT superfamily N-acetyltransferase